MQAIFDDGMCIARLTLETQPCDILDCIPNDNE
jgi:hypothetical protein